MRTICGGKRLYKQMITQVQESCTGFMFWLASHLLRPVRKNTIAAMKCRIILILAVVGSWTGDRGKFTTVWGTQLGENPLVTCSHCSEAMVLCLTKHNVMKIYWRTGGIAPPILHLCTRWKWTVSFMPRPLYPQGKSPRYPLDRRLGGPQSRSGHGGEEEKSQRAPVGNWTPVIQPVVYSLYWLSYRGCAKQK
jgi:hypothetical protein